MGVGKCCLHSLVINLANHIHYHDSYTIGVTSFYSTITKRSRSLYRNFNSHPNLEFSDGKEDRRNEFKKFGLLLKLILNYINKKYLQKQNESVWEFIRAPSSRQIGTQGRMS